MITAQVVLINPEGLILGVSRKDNHNDFGLIGGKMEPEDDGDPTQTAIRETKEETGLDIYELKLVFAIHKDGNFGYTYLAKYKGEINHKESHIVKWVAFERLTNGSFGKYNKLVGESLDDLGVQYVKYEDRLQMVKEVKEFVENNVMNGYLNPFKFMDLVPSSVGSNAYRVFMLDSNGNSLEEEFDGRDDFYEKGLQKIGDKYGFNIHIPYFYYCK